MNPCDTLNHQEEWFRIAAATYRCQREALIECEAALERLKKLNPRSFFWNPEELGGRALNHCRQLLQTPPI